MLTGCGFRVNGIKRYESYTSREIKDLGQYKGIMNACRYYTPYKQKDRRSGRSVRRCALFEIQYLVGVSERRIGKDLAFVAIQ